MRRYVVDLKIPVSELMRYYRGAASAVSTRDQYGRRVQFPAAALRPFVSRAGVYGRFVLEVSDDHRLERITPA